MLMSIITLARWTGIKIAENPADPAARSTAQPVGDSYVQETDRSASCRTTVFSGFPLGVVFVSIVTGLILILAANTAFNGFPVLGSILARTATCRASCTPAATGSPSPTASSSSPAAADLLIIVYDAEVTQLIQLYIVGVFVSFTLSQTGMIRHWNRHLRTRAGPARSGAG